MLAELYIENLAVIAKMTVCFDRGLTVFTGETGAGKSVLLDAIQLVLGQRTSKDLIRTGCHKAFVSATFTNLPDTVLASLWEAGYEVEEGTLLVSREWDMDGRSVARMQQRPVTVNFLKELAPELLHIHGQHDTFLLLQEDRYLLLVDRYAENQELLEQYQKQYREYQALRQSYRTFTGEEQQRLRRIDLLQFQVTEIEQAAIEPQEDATLAQSIKTMRHAEVISEALSTAYQALQGDDAQKEGAYTNVHEASNQLSSVAQYATEIKQYVEQLESVEYVLQDVAGQIFAFLDHNSFDPKLLRQMEQRMELLDTLKQKYGSTLEEVLTYKEQAAKELELLQQAEQNQEKLVADMKRQGDAVKKLGQTLSSVRQQAAKHLEQELAKELIFLDMPNLAFVIQINQGKYGKLGCDEVRFLFSTNRGEEMRPLYKIASGGELSRVMLAMQSVLAKKDSTDTLIFDEIDTGVSGKSAQKIGFKLKEIAESRQVLCVTHAAQVAALADHNFLLQKNVDDTRTYTTVQALDRAQKIQEVARIMGTEQPTETIHLAAREMVEQAEAGRMV